MPRARRSGPPPAARARAVGRARRPRPAAAAGARCRRRSWSAARSSVADRAVGEMADVDVVLLQQLLAALVLVRRRLPPGIEDRVFRAQVGGRVAMAAQAP